jgi:dihydroneopterin aldolase
MEVTHHAAAQDDDVDKVLSYESITEAIEAALAAERLNLLETLAERVASGCLADPRALRVFVRVEKLDRIPGAFGVEIVRMRLPEDAARLRPVAPSRAEPAARPLVLHLGAPLLEGPQGGGWLDAFARGVRPAALALAPAAPQPPARSEGALRVGLLAIEAAAWTLADRDPRLTVAATRAELEWALKTGRRPVWAPAKMLTDALPRPAIDASRPAALAAWLARELGAEALILAGADLPDSPAELALRRVGAPAEVAL